MKVLKARHVLVLALALCAASAFAAAHTEVTKVPRLPFMRGMGFDGYYENRNRTWMTRKDVYTGLVAKGFDHVRLPVDFRSYADYDSSTGVATLKEKTFSWLWSGPGFATFDTVIDNAIDAGLYIVLDFHGWFDIDPTDEATRAKFKAYWKAVSERYRNRSNKLVFELANEPHVNNGTTVAKMNSLQKETVAIIRQTNPTRLILYAVADSNQPWALTLAQNPPNYGWVSYPANDNNLALVIHCYNPGVFTHQGETWANASYTSQVRLTDTHRATLNWDLNQLTLFREDHDIPLVMNEFNVSHKLADHGDVTEYLSMVTRYCEANRIPWAPWIYYGDNSSFDCFASVGGNLIDYVKDGLFPDLKPTDEFAAGDYAHAIDIAFPGYSGSAALVDFPVLVRLSEAGIHGFRYADFRKPDGLDLCFTDASGNLIPHEIDTWDTNGVSTVWVKVPSLTAATAIVARYGCAKPIVPKVESVWDGDYVGVWHLGERKLPLADATGVSRDVTSADGTGIGYGTAGIVGGSVNFGAANSARCVNMDDHDALDGMPMITIEAWTRQAGHAQNAGILAKRAADGSQASYCLCDDGGATRLLLSADGTSASAVGVSLTPVLGAWNHQAYTVDATATSANAKGYLNGVGKGTASVACAGGIFAGAAELHVGNLHSGNAANFPGQIDEIRISRCVRSADWIKATHDTVAMAGFATYAVQGVEPPEPEPPALVTTDAPGYDWTNRVVTASNASAGAVLTLTATTPGGATTTATATADANGEAVFNVATTPGAAYAYTVSRGDVALATGGFLSGGWQADGSWFAASAPHGEPVVENGAWTTAPKTVPTGGYALEGDAAFALDAGAAASGTGGLSRIDFSVAYDRILDIAQLPSDGGAFGVICAVEGALPSGAERGWMAFDGARWLELSGEVVPRESGAYVIRAEVDFASTSPVVAYSVKEAGGEAFARLADADGREHVVCARAAEGLRGVAFRGTGRIESLKGTRVGADVAEAGGVGYASLGGALAAGGAVRLLTNATWPEKPPVGTVFVDQGGYALSGMALDGDGRAVVQRGYAAIPGEGRVDLSLADVRRLGIATDGKSPAEIAAALAANGANGIPRWKSYALGLDPSDADARPRAAIAARGGTVELRLVGIDVNAACGATVTYRVYRFPDLADAPAMEAVGGERGAGATATLPRDAAAGKMFYRLKVDVKGY